jgi:protein-S-isoprenylcysteine O-methyltransferase Ste14
MTDQAIHPTAKNVTGGLFAMLYGTASYVLFLGTILYAIAFVANLLVPKTIDSGTPGPFVESLVVNVLLLGLFAVQHSVMARPAFKRWWIRIVPPSVERATFVLFASLALLLLYWQWRPMTATIWSVADPMGAAVLQGVSLVGWLVVFASTFMINHFELFGLRQVVARLPCAATAGVQDADALERAASDLSRLPDAFWATPVRPGICCSRSPRPATS